MKTNILRLTLLSVGCLAAFSLSSLNAQTPTTDGNATNAVPLQTTPPSQNPDVPNSVAKPARTVATGGTETTLTAGQSMTVAADDTGGTKTTGVAAMPLSNADERFVKKAATAGEYEIALSRQASTSATNAQVRTYAATLVKQHEKMSTELLTLATRRGATLVSDDKHLDDLASLSKKTGNNYDGAYIGDMVDAHEDAISLFETASKSKDSDIAAFAVQYLPALKEHLAQAKQLEKLAK